MTLLRTLLFTLLTLWALLGTAAFALELLVGTEIVLTDGEGEHLLGYGLVADEGLVLEVVRGADRFLMLAVGPDGGFETLIGEIDAEGRVLLTGEDGVPFALDDRLAEVGIAFELRRVVGDDGEFDEDDDPDDDRSGPGGAPIDDDDEGGDDNSGPGSDDDEDDEGGDDNSGPGSDDDEDDEDEDDNSGPGSDDDEDDEDEDDNSGPGNSDDEDDEDRSGSGSGDEDDDDDDDDV